MVLMYDGKFLQYLGKLCMHWIGPFIIQEVTKSGTFKLQTLQGQPMKGHVNGSELKPYTDSHATPLK